MLQPDLPRMSQTLPCTLSLKSAYGSPTTSRVSLLEYCQLTQHYLSISTTVHDSKHLAFLLIGSTESNLVKLS